MSRDESPAEILERLAREREARPKLARAVRVAITGGRDHQPTEAEITAFKRIFDRLAGTELHHGDARGVDRIISSMVRRLRPEIAVVPHPADWNAHGKAAGPLRNQEMVAVVDALIVFPGGRGTQHCADAARRIGKPAYFVTDGENAQPRLAMWAIARAEHVHQPASWRWDPDLPAWIGRCVLCHSYYEASPEEAEQLERDAVEHADAHPPANRRRDP